jgi:hypothetical protein
VSRIDAEALAASRPQASLAVLVAAMMQLTGDRSGD